MPHKPEKKSQVNTAPSPNLIRRLMGGVMSPATAQRWPGLEREFVNMERTMPQEAAKTTRVKEMGPIFRYMNPDAYAVTGPLGTISLNRQLIERDKQDLGDVLTHELAHVGQGKKGFLRKLYEPSAVEDEAVNREALRPRPFGDIRLPSSRKK